MKLLTQNVTNNYFNETSHCALGEPVLVTFLVPFI